MLQPIKTVYHFEMRCWLTAGIVAAFLLAVFSSVAVAQEDGRRLMARFECNRCHEGTGLPEVPKEKHCVHCHKDILAGRFPTDKETLKRWQSHLVSIPTTPSLQAIGARFQRNWIAAFLLKPHDLRPRLLAMMPRLALTPAMAQMIATALVPNEIASSTEAQGNLASGRKLLETLGCGTCHRFSGVPDLLAAPLPISVPPAQLAEAMVLAPDLRHTRERFQPRALSGWLRNPAALKPDTNMPRLPMSEQQAEDLAAYILKAPLGPLVLPQVPARLPVLPRRVSFEEVNERVFRRTCWHCHSTPAYAMGDGGPGNSGGFGFSGRGLNVATYSDLAAGSLDEKGQRRSVFLPLADGTPRLVAVLLARQQEIFGNLVPDVRGMPLGLPALTPEQIQLVESWISQGRPQ